MKNNENPNKVIEKTKQDISVEEISYSSTRNKTGKFEENERVPKSEIDIENCIGHLRIHREGEIAGSQFNSEVLATPEDIISFVQSNLPDEVPFDEFGRSEITLETSKEIGWTGISASENIDQDNLSVEPRMPGGVEGEHNGVKGTWYPEGKWNPATKTFEVLKNEDGSIMNEKGKFEPFSQIGYVGSLPKTNKITIILERDRNSGKVVARTIFPGDNAPAFPTVIQGTNEETGEIETYVDTTGENSLETKYWKENAFLRVNPELAVQEEAIRETKEASTIDREIEKANKEIEG